MTEKQLRMMSVLRVKIRDRGMGGSIDPEWEDDTWLAGLSAEAGRQVIQYAKRLAGEDTRPHAQRKNLKV